MTARSSIRPGLVSVTFRPLSPQEIVALAVRCGLEGIEWGGDVHVPDPVTALEVRRRTEEAGLAVAAYGSYWRGSGDFGPVLDTAVALGAPTVRVWAGGQGSIEERDRDAVAASLREACERTAQAGITLSLEWHTGTLTDTLASAMALVREVSHPNLRLYWQPSPIRPHLERREEIRALLPWLTHLHVFQWTRSGDETLRHPLAEGGAEWRDVLRLVQGSESASLSERKQTRYALLEFVPDDDPAILPREATTLRHLLDEAS